MAKTYEQLLDFETPYEWGLSDALDGTPCESRRALRYLRADERLAYWAGYKAGCQLPE